jgi:hypothetical protein
LRFRKYRNAEIAELMRTKGINTAITIFVLSGRLVGLFVVVDREPPGPVAVLVAPDRVVGLPRDASVK